MKRLLGVEFVLTPKKSMVSALLKNVNSEAVELIFREWIKNYVDTKGKHLSVDGKVMTNLSLLLML